MGEIILDLAAYQDETADIRMADGNVLHLSKPSEALVLKLLRLQNLDTKDPMAVLTALNQVTQAVLNNNADGIEFDFDSVSALSYDRKAAIIEAYTGFATELQSRPTASSPASPATTETETPKRRRSLFTRFGRSSGTRG